MEQPERVACLVLVATSGGVDVARLGGAEWRHEYRASLPDVPTWFADDRTDLSDRLPTIRAPTLLLWSDADLISPLPVAHLLAERITGARLVTVAGGTHSFARRARGGSGPGHQVPSGIGRWSFTPSARRTMAIGQNPVIPLWASMKPTKPANQSHFSLWKIMLAGAPSASESMTNDPAES